MGAGRRKAGKRLTDAAFDRVKGRLRLDLIQLQQQVRKAGDFPVVLVLSGVRGAGLMDTLNLLNSWMDPRWIRTDPNDVPSDEERERPFFWRYWRTLPGKGTIGLYLGGWYDEILSASTAPKRDANRVKRLLPRIRAFERTLADDGALIIKLWLQDGTKRKRSSGKDPLMGLLLSDGCLVRPKSRKDFIKAGRSIIRKTGGPHAPWHVVDGHDHNYRRAKVLTILRDAMKAHLLLRKTSKKPVTGKKRKTGAHKTNSALSALDMSAALTKTDYVERFLKQQLRLRGLQDGARASGLTTVIVFEGRDAAGKGGAIRRLTYALSPRNYRVVPIAAPNEEERSYHYLWRFWRYLPRAGRMTIMDRSWYGRVLVERVEKLIPAEAWMRAYDEINAFEAQLTEHGILLLKFWLHIDKDIQLERFKVREGTAYKRWKLTADDWRNRRKWSQYAAAVDEMLERTSTAAAPWHLIPANDKRYARTLVLETVADSMETALAKCGKGGN